LENGCNINDESFCSKAAKGGHLDLLQWAQAQGMNTISDATGYAAARAGHVKILQWLKDNNYYDDRSLEDVEQIAAELGYIHVLQWVLENSSDQKLSSKSVTAAASTGRVTVITWLREHGAEWDDYTTECAAALCPQILIWLIDNGCPNVSENVCTELAAKGKLELLKRFAEKGILSFSAMALSKAAFSGHLEV